MTWYYVPSGSLASVPAQEVLTSECMTLWADALAQSYSWNTKSLPAKSWQRVLRTVPWMTRRSGLTSTPSTAALGVAAWLESLGAIPASPSPSPGNGSGSTTLATSGRASSESLARSNPNGASSRTWLDTFGLATTTLLDRASNALATGSRKASSARRKSAPLTAGNGSSSWPTPHGLGNVDAQGKVGTGNGSTLLLAMWPTPDAQQYGSTTGHNGERKPLLGRTAQQWPTARAEDSESAGNHPKATDSLTGAVRLWPTAQAHDAQGAKTPEQIAAMRERTQAGISNLNEVAAMWPTPDTQNARDGATMRAEAKGSHAVSLHHKVAEWQTPAPDSFRSRGGERKDEQGLDQQARGFWMTPSANEDQAKGFPRSLPVPETLPHGDESSPPGPTSPRRSLNPRFVEWLMGWPIDHTSLIMWCKP